MDAIITWVWNKVPASLKTIAATACMLVVGYRAVMAEVDAKHREVTDRFAAQKVETKDEIDTKHKVTMDVLARIEGLVEKIDQRQWEMQGQIKQLGKKEN